MRRKDYVMSEVKLPTKLNNKDFTKKVTKFYENLSSKQELLGGDFENVLNKNLQELYGS